MRTEIKSCVEALRSDVLRDAAAAFYDNIERLSLLSALPFSLVALGSARLHQLALTVEILAPGRTARKYLDSAESRAEISALIHDKSREASHVEKVMEEAVEVFRGLFERQELLSAYEALALSNVASTWTALEALVSHAWIVVVNARPIPLGQRAIQQTPGDIDGLSRKQISVGVLARFGFDLRSALGTVLAPKFDFTSQAGITNAYRAAFGDDSQLLAVFSDPALGHLEATRHVIVHAAGRVDTEFARRVPSSPAIGSRLVLQAEDFERYRDLVVGVGCRLLRFLDQWLEEPPPEGA